MSGRRMLAAVCVALAVLLPVGGRAAEPGPALAIVVQDQTVLRAAPRDGAPQQAVLWQGDAVEVRGERHELLQVYDHRRERAGFVRASQVRRIGLAPADAPALLAVLRFLRDTPGAEPLGIAYVAAYLRAAPVEAIDAEPFDALGAMAERLARRASARQGLGGDALLAAHVEVAAAYGVVLASFEREGRSQLCYDGEAWRRVLALPATPVQRARAVLALTRHDCIDPALPPAERRAFDEARAELLERIDIGTLPEMFRQRVHLRRAGVWAGVAHARARQGGDAATAARHALDELAAVPRAELADGDAAAYADAAVRTSASRWAAEPGVPTPARAAPLHVEATPGRPGETCLLLVDARHDAADPLLRRCSFGIVWAQSASLSPSGKALAVAVQPLPDWRELWVFRQVGGRWSVDVLPAASGTPELGVIEFAGWVPGGSRLLVAREARVEGRFRRSFEVLRLDTLATVERAERAEDLCDFRRWQDPAWKRQTVALR